MCLLWLALGLGGPAVQAQNLNDDWFTPTALTNIFGGSLFDDNIGATKNGGGFFSSEPNHSGNPGGASVWYQWTPQVSGTATIRVTNQGGFRSNLFAIYPALPYAQGFGGFNTPLTGGVVASNAVAGGFTNQIQFPIVGGQTYLIAVDGFNSGLTTNQGFFQLEYGLWDNDLLTNSHVLPGSLGTLSFSNLGATNEVGEPFHGGTNDPGGASVWFAWTAPLSGPATFQVTPTTFFTLTNMLMSVYTNSSGTTNLSPVALGLVTNNFYFNTNVVLGVTNVAFNVTNHLTFDAVAGTTYYLAVAGRIVNFTPREGVFTLAWSSKISETAGQFQMGPITDGAVLDSSLGSFFGGVFGRFSYGPINFYAVTENESSFLNASSINDIYDLRGAVITITRTNGAMGRMALGYRTRDVTALAGYDYVATNGVVIFDDFQMSTNILIRILYNDISTNDSMFEVVLTNAVVDTNIFTDIAGNNYVESPAFQPTFNYAPMTVLIRNTDNPLGGRGAAAGTIQFYRAHYRIPENLQTFFGSAGARLEVMREGGDQNVAATVNYHINGTVTGGSHGNNSGLNFGVQAGSDYALVALGGRRLDDLGLASYAAPGVATFPPNGENFTSIRIPVRNDTTVEFNEDIIVTLDDSTIPPSPSPLLNNGAGYRLGSQTTAILTILFEDERGEEQPAGAADNTHNLDNDSTTDPPFNLLPGANNVVYGVAIQPDGRSVIVGDFTAFNTRPFNRIARMLTNGQSDVSFTPGSGADNFINAVVLQPDGKFLIGGGFSSYTGVSRNGIARLNANGTLDATFNPGAGINSGSVAANAVQAIALQPDGRVLIAGNFTTVNNLNYARVARLNADGSVDRLFVPGFGANDRVNTITVNTNVGSVHFGKIIVGGAFTAFNRVSRNGVAVLNPDGTLDTTVFDHLGVGANGAVYAAAVQPDDRILLGGAFTTIDFRPRAGVARLNVDGSLDATFDPGSGADQPVYSLVLQPDSTIYIGGSFNIYNQTRRMGVARLYPSGILDTTFLDTAYNQFAGITTPITTMPRAVCYAIALQSDGKVMIGGQFTRVGGGLAYPRPVTRADVSFRNNIVRLIGGFTPGPGNIDFITPDYTMDEGGGSLFVTVTRTNGFLGAATMYFNTTNGTANVGADYLGATNQAITWPSVFFDLLILGEELAPAFLGPNNNVINPYSGGQINRGPGGGSNNRLLVGPIQDRVVEGNENFSGRLSIPGLNTTNPPILNLGGDPIPVGIALGRQNTTFTISDDDFLFGDIGFSTANYTATENSVAAVISVVRSNGVTGTVSIRYDASAGPGATLANFVPVSGILTFAPGQTNQSFSVPLLDDTVTNGVRIVNLTLSRPTGGATTNGTIAAATLNVLDNEPPAGTPAGSVNTAFGNGVGPDGDVLAVTYVTNLPPALGLNGKWLIAGDFRVVDRIPRPGMALLNLDGSVETAIFTKLGSGPDASVYSLAIHTNAANTNLYGRIVIGGSFLNADGTPRARIARLNPDGSLDTAFNPSAGADNPVYSVAIQSDDRVLIGGDFSSYNGSPRVRLARLNSDGSLDPTFSTGQGADGLVRSVVVEPSGNILVGGDFNFFDGVPLPYLVRLTPSGALDQTFSPGLDGRVRSIVLDASTNIVLTGDFTMVGTQPANRITRLLPGGGVDLSFITSGADRPIYSVAVDLAGNLIIGGDFSTVNGFARARVARLTPNGELDSSVNFGTGPNNFVAAVALEPVPNGLITIGGGFTEVDTIPRNYIAQLLNGVNAGVGQLQFASTNFNVDENGQLAEVVVRRIGGLTNSISVNYTTQDGTALAGTDYTAQAGTLVFLEGEAAKSYTVGISNNSITNINKILNNQLSSPSNVTAGVAVPGLLGLVTNATLTIIDDDSVFAFSFPTYSVSEGVVGSNAVISVSRLGGTLGNMTVTYSTSNLTATAGSDYVGITNATLAFTNGQTTALFLVGIIDDQLVEGNESVQMILSNPTPGTPSSTATLGRSLAELRIVDDDFRPGTLNFSLSSYSVDEAATNVTLTVVRTNGTTGLVTVRYNTLDGTALAGVDYVATTGFLPFGDGESVKTFTIPIILDTLSEPSETFDVVLSAPTGNAQLGGVNSARVTIANNDIATFGNLIFSANSYVTTETNSSVVVTINRIGGRNGTLTVTFSTSAGTAIPGVHYAEVTQIVTFTNGQTTATVPVAVLRSPLVEGDKTVNLSLNTVTGGASLGVPNTALLTIRDVDSSPGALGFLAGTFSYPENLTNALITVVRTNGFSGVVSVQYTTTNLTATAGTNYVGVSGSLTFTNGQTTATFGVPLLDNNFYGGDVVFGVRLFGVAGGASLSLTNATVRILDNESPGGSLDANFNVGTGANAPVFALGVNTNGFIVLGGDFTLFNGVTRFNVAQLKQDGSVDATFDAGPISARGTNSSVRALAVYGGGTNANRVLIGGVFDTINGVGRTNLARLRLDGTIDPTFNPGLGPNNNIAALAIQNDGRVVVAGYFTAVGGVAKNFIARLNDDGSLDSTFNLGGGANGVIRSVAVDNNLILIGGDFTQYEGVTRNYVARLNPDGSLDKNFDPGTGANGPVNTLFVDSSSRVLIGGNFTSISGVPRGRIARLNPDGSPDGSFNPSSGADQFVSAVVVQGNGTVLAGGGFETVEGRSRNRFARLQTSGLLDLSINLGSGANDFVAALALQADGKILAAGGFTVFDGLPYNYLVRLNGGINAGEGSFVFDAPNYTVAENGTNVTVTVRRSGGLFGANSVQFTTVDGSASSLFPNPDYLATNGTLDFLPGEVFKTFAVQVLTNGLVDGDRLVVLSLLNPSGTATLGAQSQATVTILDDDCVVGFSAPSYSVNDNGTNATITVRRAGGRVGLVSVDYFTVDGTALAGRDYQSVSNRLTWLDGDLTAKTFTVPILPNPMTNLNRTLDLYLTNLVNSAGSAVIQRVSAQGAAVLTIVDNESGPGELAFTAPNYFVAEAAGLVTITVVRTNGSYGPVSVDFLTSNGTAINQTNYSGASGRFFWADGDISPKTFTVGIIPDALPNADRTVNLTLANPAGGALIAMPNSLLTIVDDDATITLSAAAYTALEPAGFALITVLRNGAANQTVNVQFSTVAGSALAGIDYLTVVTNLVFAPGVVSITVPVPVIDDTNVTGDHGFNVQLASLASAPNGVASFGSTNAAVTIVDDDALVQFAVTPYNVLERAGRFVVTVTRTGSTANSVTVDFSTANLTALAGLDYVATNGTLTFGVGVASQTFAVTILDNTVLNPDRQLQVNLVNLVGPAGVRLGAASSAVVTILDDEAGVSAGSVDAGFNFALGADGPVNSIAFLTNGQAWVGGDFFNLHGARAVRVGRLNADGTVDPSFNPGLGPDAAVWSVAVGASNSVVIGGAFTSVNGTSAIRIARLTSGGAPDPTFQVGSGPDNTVFAVAVDLTGGTLIGGAFLTVNGTNLSRLARLDANGAVDASFNVGTGANGIVRAITVQPDGRILIGGDFTSYNGTSVNRLARLNQDGSFDGTFTPGLGADAVVNAILVNTNGTVLVGGAFTNFNGFTRNGLVQLNPDGSHDAGFNVGVAANGPVNALGTRADGRFTVVGNFTTMNGFPRPRVARLNIDGSVDATFNPGLGADAEVRTVAAYAESVAPPIPVAASGGGIGSNTNAVNTGSTAGVLTLDVNTLVIPDNLRVYYEGVRLLDTNFAARLTFNIPYGPGTSTVVTIIMNEGGVGGSVWNYTGSLQPAASASGADRALIGGVFTNFNGELKRRITALNDGGTGLAGFGLGRGGAQVQSLAIVTNSALPGLLGKVVVGGTFNFLHGVATKNLTRLNVDGSIDLAFNPGTGPDAGVSGVAVQADGRVLAVGYFQTVAGISRSGIARFATDGSLDPTFDPGIGANNPVFAVALQPDGKAVVGGSFTIFNTTLRNLVARLNADGTVDASFDPGVGPNDQVRAVAVQADGRILVAGDFTQFAGQARGRLARLTATGALDPSFNTGSGFGGAVSTVVIDAAGKILVGGSFTSFNGAPAMRMVRLNPDGSLDGSFNLGSGFDDAVQSIAVQVDGRIVAGGDFTTVGGFARSRIARLNTDGSIDPTINFGLGADSGVSAVLVQFYDGRIVAGGAFVRFDGVLADRLVRLNGGNNAGSGSFEFEPAGFARLESGVTAQITVLRRNGLTGAASVQYQDVVGGTAVAGVNYQGISPAGTLNFASGQGSAIFNVGLLDDGVSTGNLLANLRLLNPVGAVLGLQNTATLTILDDDATLAFSNSAYSINERGGQAVIDVVRTGGTNGVVTVDFGTVPGGTATAGVDYTNVTGVLVFGDGETLKMFTVPIIDDAIVEGNETVMLALSNPKGQGAATARLGAQATATLVIVDDEFSPGVLSFATNASQVSESGTVTITVNRLNGSRGLVSVSYLTADVTAQAGLDYTAAAGSLSWADGDVTPKTFTIATIEDALVEGLETLNLALSLPTGGASLGSSNAVLTLVDNDGVVQFAAANYSVMEASTNVVITVLRTGATNNLVSVNFSTVGGSAVAGVDFTPTNGTLIFTPGATSLTFSVTILDDQIAEPTKTVGFALSGLTGAAFLGTQINTVLTILDNDISVQFGAASFSVSEGTSNAVISVTRAGNLGGTNSVTFSTSDGTATAGADYLSQVGTVTFLPGETNKTFTLTILQDTLVEASETVNLTLSLPTGGAVLGTPAVASLAILDDDASFEFTAATFSVAENAGSVTISVRRNGQTTGAASVDFAAFDGTATGGVDYASTNGILVFAAGVAVRTFDVDITDDALPEGDETVNLALSNPAGAVLGVQRTAVLTIVDNDTFVQFSSAVFSVQEDRTNAVITLIRSGQTNGVVTVDYATAAGTAVAGTDYANTSGTATFPAGVTSAVFQVSLTDNLLRQANRTVNLSLANASANALLGAPSTATLRIVDNDRVGSVDSPFNVRFGANNTVYAVAFQPDGKVLFAGDFTAVNGTNINRVARLNPDGSLDATFNPGLGANNVVYALALATNGQVLIGGSFTAVNGTNANFLARLNADGSLDTTYTGGAGMNGAVLAIALQVDGKAVVGGAFTAVTGGLRNHIARLLTSGTMDATFNPGRGADNTVYAVTLDATENILIGGLFNTVALNPRTQVAMLAPNGALDNFIAPQLSAGGRVYALAVQPDGNLLIAGQFTQVDSYGRTNLARLLMADGTVDPLFNPTLSPSSTVRALALQGARSIVLAGDFTAVNGQARSGIGRLNADGSLDAVFDSGIGADGTVYAAVTRVDGKVLLGGDFTTVDGIARRGVALLNGNLSQLAFTAATASVLEDAGSVTLTVRRTGDTNSTVTVPYLTTDFTALAGVDYVTNSGVLIFTNGQTTNLINVGVLNDQITETAEDFFVRLGVPVGEVMLGAITNVTVTIVDNDSILGLATNSLSVAEAGGGVDVTVFRLGSTTGTVSVVLATADGTALAGSDYTGITNVLTFGPGVSLLTNRIAILNDRLVAASRQFTVTLGAVTGEALAGGITNATVTITDDDSVVQFALGATNVLENVGTAALVVTRTGDLRNTVTLPFATAFGTALSGIDFIATNGTLTFGPGESNKTISVTVINDTIAEPNKGFVVNLGVPTGEVTLGANTSVAVTILDDDSTLQFSAAAVTVLERTTNATLTVIRRGSTNTAVTVVYNTVNGLALAGADYTFASGLLSFPAGVSTQALVIPILNDKVVEGVESFTVNLSAPTGEAILGAPSAVVVSIQDDDSLVQFSGVAASVVENAGIVTLTVNRTGNIDSVITVPFSFANATAFNGTDYRGTNGLITFGSNVASQTITVDIVNDKVIEPNKAFSVVLGAPQGEALLGVNTSTLVTIVDDDSTVQFTAGSVGVAENGGSITVTIQRQGVTNNAVAVQVMSINGGATAGLDFVAVNTNVTFNPGEVTKSIAVGILQDLVAESSETFQVALSNPTGELSLGAQPTVTITIDDVRAVVPAGFALVTESLLPANQAVDPNEQVTVSFSLRNLINTATANLVATLLPGGGVGSPGGPQNYGALARGTDVARSFTFRADAVQTVVATLQLQDGAVNLGTAVFTIDLGSPYSFTNRARINIPGTISVPSIGAANPYPSSLAVANVPGVINKVTVRFNQLTHTFPADISAVVVGPGGQAVLLMAHAGGGFGVTNANITFADAAAVALPNLGQITSGAYRPTSYLGGATLPAPAPPAPYNDALSVFNGQNPNGTWSLYLLDDTGQNDGVMFEGWTLSLATATPSVDVVLNVTAAPDPAVTGSNLTYTANIRNSGVTAVSGLSFTNVLPAGVTFVSATSSQGPVTHAGGRVIANVGALTVAGNATVSIVVAPFAAGLLTNTASLGVNEVELNLQNNTVRTVTPVNGPTQSLFGGVSLTNGTFGGALNGVPGRTYVVEVSTNFVTWIPLSTNTTLSGALNFIDTNVRGFRLKFYRAIER